jgi:isoquinoline 1-oxidoreductase subunit beta
MSTNFSRRSFLVASGLSASFLWGCSSIPAIPKRPQPNTEAALGWISLTSEGQWRLYCPRMEMGQNILSSLREIAALELGIAPEQIQVQLPSTTDIALVKATVGSDSIKELCLPLALACYALRVELERRTAARAGAKVSLKDLAVPPMKIEVKDVAQDQLRFFQTPPSFAYKPKSFAQAESILRGQALFTGDVRIPGMLYAIVLRSPWADHDLVPTKLLKWNEAAVRAVPGFHSIVTHRLLAGPALVATRMSAIELMRSAAQAQWSEPEAVLADPIQTVDVDKALTAGSFTKNKGSVQTGEWAVNMRLDVPSASHAFIEPRCAVAQPKEHGMMMVWCGTQDMFYVRDVIRRDLDVAPEKVQVQAMRIGGAFGGKTIATVEREAALIAKALNAPVKVQWSRADEFQAGFQRQPTSQRIRARLNSDGMITDWQHSLSTSHVLFTNAVAPPWMQRITNIIGDDGAARGQAPVYGFERQQLSLQLTRLPLLTGPWRGLGAGPNVLAIEMAMDAVALAAKKDPVAFRLAHLKSATGGDSAGDRLRLAQCLERVVVLEKNKPFVNKQTLAKTAANAKIIVARGVACGAYKAMSYAAAIAQIELTVDSTQRVQSIRVLKLWCTHDCGRMIDAQGVLAQVQGNLVWTIGMVLKEQLLAPKGTPTTLNFFDYSIPRISDTPEMEIELLDSNLAPSGAGETAMVAGAGAIANAVTRAMRELGLPAPLSMPIAVAS